MKKVAIAYDGTSAGQAIFDYINLHLSSKLPKLELTVLRVVDEQEVKVDAMNLLFNIQEGKKHQHLFVQNIVQNKIPHVTFHVEIMYGDPTKEILSFLKGNPDIEMLIIGMNTKGGLRELINGSVTIKLLKHAVIPILVVK